MDLSLGRSSYLPTMTKPILQAVNFGQRRAVTSEISLLEILVQPLKLGLEKVVDDYKYMLDNFPNMTLYPVTRDVTLQAATLRAKYYAHQMPSF